MLLKPIMALINYYKFVRRVDMPDWLVNLIVGLASAILGFVSGIITKSYSIKVKQKIKGNGNKQQIGDIDNGEESGTKN